MTELCRLTFLTGQASVLLHFHTVQIEGVAVVSERHPGPVSYSLGAAARVNPSVTHRPIWQREKHY